MLSADVAQLVVRLPCKQTVAGSIPVVGSAVTLVEADSLHTGIGISSNLVTAMHWT